jgi:hypothetical protein
MPSEWDYYSCGTVALMILGQYSDICGPTFRIFQWNVFDMVLAQAFMTKITYRYHMKAGSLAL